MKIMKKEFLEREFSHIYEHIKLNCAENMDYSWLLKGWIIVDDESGELTDCIKMSLHYDELKNDGKVYEMDIDDTWTPVLRKKGEMTAREYWNKLVAGAYKANHGLLVLNISNLEVFAQCWKLKQLAKQKDCDRPRPLIAWAPESKKDIAPIDREFFIDKTVPKEFAFDGYVLMIINGISWKDVREYAMSENSGEFNAMMEYYCRLRIDD